jgi:1-acyl-sn-glycerol-3-phosphate acyltransferase
MIRTAIVAILLSLWVVVLGPPLILYTLITRSADLMYWVGVKGVVWITYLAGLRVRVVGLENIPAGVCMFAANHTSNADAAAIVGAIPRRLAIFGRKSLFDIPIVGLAFRLAKFVPVDRGNREAALASAKQAVEYMKTGSSFLVYPEGTRSPDGRLARFKKGTFAMAIEAGVPIVPLACSGAHRVMKKKSLIIHAGKVTVSFGKPIDAAGYTIDQRDDLARRVHDAIAVQLPEDQKPAASPTPGKSQI